MKKFAAAFVASAIVVVAALGPSTTASASTVDPTPGQQEAAPSSFDSGAMLEDPGCQANVIPPGTNVSSGSLSGEAAAVRIDLPNAWRFYGLDMVGLELASSGWVTPSYAGVNAANDPYAMRVPRAMWQDHVPGQSAFMPLQTTWSIYTTSTYGNYQDPVSGVVRDQPFSFPATPGTYGTIEYQGHWALCVEWRDVNRITGGSINVPRDSKKNSFQAVFVDRSDIAPGEWDLIYNYGSVEWVVTREVDDIQQFGGTVSAMIGWTAYNPNTRCNTLSNYSYQGFDLWPYRPFRADGRSDRMTDMKYVSPGNYRCAELPHGYLIQHTDQRGSVFTNDSPLALAKTSTHSDVLGRHEWSFRSGIEVHGDGDHILDWMAFDYNPSVDVRPPLAPYSTLDDWTTIYRPYEPGIVVDGLKVIGDSYISGEGTGYYYDNTDISGVNKCHRSLRAYPALLASSDGPFGPVRFDSWACSGSVISNLTSNVASQNDPPWNDPSLKQSDLTITTSNWKSAVDRLSATDAVVEISISGNDMGFVPIVTDCVKAGATGSIVEWVDPELGVNVGNSCISHEGELKDSLSRIVDGDSLLQLFRAVHARAPHALILVSGYPKFYSDSLTGNLNANLACWGTTPAVKKWINGWISQLNDGISAQVAESRAKGIPVNYIDIEDVTKSHELCSSASTASWYMNGIKISDKYGQENMHPNDRGHIAIASLISSSFVADQQFHPAGARVDRMVVVVPERQAVYIQLPPINPVMDAYMAGVSVSATTAGGTVLTPYYAPGGGTARITGDQVRMAVDPLGQIGDADVDMVLVAPDGTRYEVGDQVDGFTSIESPTVESMQLAGTDFTGWQLELTGVNMPTGGQQVYVDVSYDQAPNVDPVALIDATVNGRTVTVSAQRSSDPDGEVTDYFWDFGDGATATGATATHTYDFDASKNVALEVTDDRGGVSWAITEVLTASTLSLKSLTTLNGAVPPAAVAPGSTLSLKADVGATFALSQLAGDALAQRQVPCDGIGDPGVGELLAGPDNFPSIASGSPTAVGFTVAVPAAWDGTCHQVVLTLTDRSQASVTFKVETPSVPEPTTYFEGFTSWAGWGDAPETVHAGYSLAFGVDLTGKQGRDALKAKDITTRLVSCESGDPLGTWAKASHAKVGYNRWTGDFSVIIDTSRAWAGTCREVQTAFGDGSTASFIVYVNSPSYHHRHHFTWFRGHGRWH